MPFWIVFSDFYFNSLVPFVNSNFFVALVTGLAGGTAIWLYQKQKKENKQQIATLLINDIRNAQSAIQQVQDSLSVSNAIPEITVLPENNWKKHSYLFSKDLDQDETLLVNKFFSNAERISYIVTQFNNMFLIGISDRDAAIQNENMRIVANSKNLKQAQSKLKLFDGILNNQISTSPYLPSGFYTKLKNYLTESSDILNTNIGQKLKRIADGK